MGFSMEITILRPVSWVLTGEDQKEERGRAVAWTPEGIMTGYASWPGPGRSLPKGPELADLSMLSWVYGKIIQKAKRPSRRIFAPPFVVPEDYRDDRTILFFSPEQWLRDRASTHPAGEPVVLPWWNSSETPRAIPTLEKRLEHNKILALSRRKYRVWRGSVDYDGGMFTRPFMWERCSVLARWLRELKGNGGHTCQEVLRGDPEALAIVRARCAYFVELGKVDYRALFTHEGNYYMRLSPYL